MQRTLASRYFKIIGSDTPSREGSGLQPYLRLLDKFIMVSSWDMKFLCEFLSFHNMIMLL